MSESLTGMRPAHYVLEVEHVAKAYGGHQVLKDISFRMEPGEITAVIGENGSGKSTLLNLIAGRLRADEGRIAFSGTLMLAAPGPTSRIA
jgi:ABC-type multidrug transport system ATPase subunit